MADGTVQENNVWAVLPSPSFRGVKFPIVDRKVTHSYESVETGQFRQGAFAQIVGDGAWRFRYEIPMKQGFQSGFKDVFKTTHPQLLAFYEEGKQGTLVDPIMGAVDVIPGTWEESANSETKNGVTVSLEFIRTVMPGADEEPFKVETTQAIAIASNEFFTQAATVPWEQEPSPETTTDPFKQLAGTIERVRASIDTMDARVNAVINNVNSVMDSADRLQSDPSVQSRIIADGRKLRATAQRAKDYSVTIGTNGPKVFLVPRPMSWAALAKFLRVPFEDLVEVNRGIAGKPVAEPGTKVNIPSGK